MAERKELESRMSNDTDFKNLLQNLCSVCHVEPPKYKCPACLTRTCSAVCSKRHKEQSSCTGIVDPTRYLKKSELLSDVHTLNRDYNFLQRMDRQIHVAVNELEDKMPKRKVRGAGMSQSNKKRKANNSEDNRKVIVRNGVNIHQLPDGMSRALNNRTGWMGKKTKFFGWTVEWVLWDSGAQENIGATQENVGGTQESIGATSEPHTQLSHAISESTILEDAAARSLFPSRMKKDATAEKLDSIEPSAKYRYFLQKVPAPAKSPGLILLSPSTSLRSNLQDKSVIEYPTIHVVAEEYELPKRYTIIGEDYSSSDSDSDSSESDSESSDSSDESDDEPPEESSSKQSAPDLEPIETATQNIEGNTEKNNTNDTNESEPIKHTDPSDLNIEPTL